MLINVILISDQITRSEAMSKKKMMKKLLKHAQSLGFILMMLKKKIKPDLGILPLPLPLPVPLK